jgi:hypothetical protein
MDLGLEEEHEDNLVGVGISKYNSLSTDPRLYFKSIQNFPTMPTCMKLQMLRSNMNAQPHADEPYYVPAHDRLPCTNMAMIRICKQTLNTGASLVYTPSLACNSRKYLTLNHFP